MKQQQKNSYILGKKIFFLMLKFLTSWMLLLLSSRPGLSYIKTRVPSVFINSNC